MAEIRLHACRQEALTAIFPLAFPRRFAIMRSLPGSPGCPIRAESRAGKKLAYMKDDDYWMGLALQAASKAGLRNEVPIGAVIVRDGKVLGSGYNLRESHQDPAAHAELIAIRRAAQRTRNWRLTGATLYVTLEPCIMCMGASILARIDRLVYGCPDPKAGAAGTLYDLSCDSRLNHRFIVESGVRGAECAALLSDFFRELRQRKKKAGL